MGKGLLAFGIPKVRAEMFILSLPYHLKFLQPVRRPGFRNSGLGTLFFLYWKQIYGFFARLANLFSKHFR